MCDGSAREERRKKKDLTYQLQIWGPLVAVREMRRRYRRAVQPFVKTNSEKYPSSVHTRNANFGVGKAELLK